MQGDFSSPMHRMLKVSCSDPAVSDVHRTLVHHLSSTNIQMHQKNVRCGALFQNSWSTCNLLETVVAIATKWNVSTISWTCITFKANKTIYPVLECLKYHIKCYQFLIIEDMSWVVSWDQRFLNECNKELFSEPLASWITLFERV